MNTALKLVVEDVRDTTGNWTDAFTRGSRVLFCELVDQGPHLRIARGEVGTVVGVIREGHLRVAIRMHAPHWQLGESNVLMFDEHSDDILSSLGINLHLHATVDLSVRYTGGGAGELIPVG